MPKGTPKVWWTGAKIQAAIDVAEDKLSEDEIAKRAGCSRRGLFKWKCHPEFIARVQEHIKAFDDSIFCSRIARRSKRVEVYNDIWQRIQKVIAERAGDPEMQAIPGGTTGLLVKDYKVVSTKQGTKAIPVFAVDTASLRELRAQAEQAARELGQWSEKQDVNVNGDRPTLVIELADPTANSRPEQSESTSDSGNETGNAGSTVCPPK